MAYNLAQHAQARQMQIQAAHDVLRVLLDNRSPMTKTALARQCLVKGSFQRNMPLPQMVKIIGDIISTFEGQLFTIEARGKEEVIRPYTSLQLCPEHCTKSGCQMPSMCGGLHLCKSFTLGVQCRFQQGRRNNCLFGHNIGDPHNLQLLHSHNLSGLSEEQIKSILQQNRSRATLPRVCKFYNVDKGCRSGPEGLNCTSLHVCKFYVQDKCGFGSRCKRSHDIYSAQPKQLLIKHGINVQRSPKDVLEDLREAMGEGSEVSSVGSSSPQKRNPQRARSRSRTPSRGSGRNQELLAVEFGDLDITDPKGMTSQRSLSESEGDPLDDTDEICTFFLRGRCNYGQSCRKHHCHAPYQWQYKDQGWTNFAPDSNEEIELNFSDPVNDECFTEWKDKTGRVIVVTVNFSSMTVKKSSRQYSIRRLSTLSFAKAAPTYIFVTKWTWFWLDEFDCWKKYGDPVVGSTDTICSIHCREIEESYLENTVGNLGFSTSKHRYSLMFDRMIQKNLKYGTERKVVRRPEFVSQRKVVQLQENKELPDSSDATDDAEMAENSTAIFETKVPEHWQFTQSSDSSEYQLIALERNGKTIDEYNQVQKLFYETMPKSSYPITKISRVQNLELWDKYTRNKIWRNKKTQKDQEEKFLFHGTKKQYIPAICQQGFDWRIAGFSVGTRYGKGSYFARTARMSKDYTDCNLMLVVRVLVGEYTQGMTTYVKPPPKDPKNPTGALFDTCVDNMENPRMFIVFEQERSYPEYLVQYDCV